jgi:hypothetical protein
MALVTYIGFRMCVYLSLWVLTVNVSNISDFFSVHDTRISLVLLACVTRYGGASSVF